MSCEKNCGNNNSCCNRGSGYITLIVLYILLVIIHAQIEEQDI